MTRQARHKDCSSEGCDRKIKIRHYFCRKCLDKIPNHIRSGIFNALHSSDYTALKYYLEQSRESLKRMGTENKDTIEVTLHKRRESHSGKSMAFWAGDYEDSENFKKELWVWLPYKCIEIDNTDGDVCVVTVPEWLAIEKGLV